MPDIPHRICKECGRISYGHKCRKCYRDKKGIPISKYSTNNSNTYQETFNKERDLTIFEWGKDEED